MTRNIDEAATGPFEVESKFEKAESFDELAGGQSGLVRFEAPSADGPFPTLAAGRRDDHERRVGCGIRWWQSKQPRQPASDRVVSVHDPQAAAGATGRVHLVQTSNRLGNEGPVLTEDA